MILNAYTYTTDTSKVLGATPEIATNNLNTLLEDTGVSVSNVGWTPVEGKTNTYTVFATLTVGENTTGEPFQWEYAIVITDTGAAD